MEEPFPSIDEEPIGSFLDRLAARSAGPAGGASAALQLAQAAALVAMVARFCEDTDRAADMDDVRRRAVRLVSEDAAAYAGVLSARPGQRGPALVAACAPQVEVWDLATKVIEAARPLVRGVSRRLAPDLAAGAVSAAGALRIAAGNVHANLRDTPSPDAERLRGHVAATPEFLRIADEVSGASSW